MPQMTEIQKQRVMNLAVEALRQIKDPAASGLNTLRMFSVGQVDVAELNYARPYTWAKDRIKRILRNYHEEMNRREKEPKLIRAARKLKGQALINYATKTAAGLDLRIKGLSEDINALTERRRAYQELKWDLLSIARKDAPLDTIDLDAYEKMNEAVQELVGMTEVDED